MRQFQKARTIVLNLNKSMFNFAAQLKLDWPLYNVIKIPVCND